MKNEKELIEIQLEKYSNLISDSIRFGSKLIDWDTEKRPSGDENLPPILFLRNILELGDAISILIKKSSIDPCKIILRSLIENVFGLEYLLEKDTKNRALSYLVWHTKNDLKFYKKLDLKTEVGKQFDNEIKKDRFLKNAKNISDISNLAEANKNALEMLKLPHYISVESEYKRTESKKKNPNWYTLYDGPDNIDNLAKHLKLNASYEVMFRGFSNSVHANDNIKQKLISNQDGTASIKGIRATTNLDSIYQNTINYILMTFMSYCKYRLPEKNNNFLDWYSDFREKK